VKGVTIIKHPLVQHNLTRLRDQRTGPQEFRRVLSEVAALMLYEATRSFQVQPASVQTPLARARGSKLQREVVLVPVLRAGLAMPASGSSGSSVRKPRSEQCFIIKVCRPT